MQQKSKLLILGVACLGASISTVALGNINTQHTQRKNTILLTQNTKKASSESIATPGLFNENIVMGSNTPPIYAYENGDALINNYTVAFYLFPFQNYSGAISLNYYGNQVAFDSDSKKYATLTLYNCNLKTRGSASLLGKDLAATAQVYNLDPQISNYNPNCFSYNDILAVNFQDTGKATMGIVTSQALSNSVNGFGHPNTHLLYEFKKGVTTYLRMTPQGFIPISGLYVAPNSHEFNLAPKGVTNLGTAQITNSSVNNIYWSNSNLVINGNLNLKDSPNLSPDATKKLVIKNSKGQIVTSINTTAINWYSNDENNYSGFQGVIPSSALSALKQKENYSFYIEMNNEYVPLSCTIPAPSNGNYSISSNSNKQLVIKPVTLNTKNIIKDGTGSYETGYFINKGYVINGNINLNNDILNQSDNKVLLVKNAQGQVVSKINCASMNWYSNNKDNYSSFQGIVPNSVLQKLGNKDSYTLDLSVFHDGKSYEMPINNSKDFILNGNSNYNISTNSNNNIIISKATTYSAVDSGTSSFESGYWKPYGYVINAKINITQNIKKGTPVELISKNPQGQVTSVTATTGVNWYSKNNSDYNGFQSILTPDQVIEASGTNHLYARINIDGKCFETPLTGNISKVTKNDNFSFNIQSKNNQINLIVS